MIKNFIVLLISSPMMWWIWREIIDRDAHLQPDKDQQQTAENSAGGAGVDARVVQIPQPEHPPAEDDAAD